MRFKDPDVLTERGAQVFLDDTVKADLPRGTDMGPGYAVTRLVIDWEGPLDLGQQPRS